MTISVLFKAEMHYKLIGIIFRFMFTPSPFWNVIQQMRLHPVMVSSNWNPFHHSHPDNLNGILSKRIDRTFHDYTRDKKMRSILLSFDTCLSVACVATNCASERNAWWTEKKAIPTCTSNFTQCLQCNWRKCKPFVLNNHVENWIGFEFFMQWMRQKWTNGSEHQWTV